MNQKIYALNTSTFKNLKTFFQTELKINWILVLVYYIDLRLFGYRLWSFFLTFLSYFEFFCLGHWAKSHLSCLRISLIQKFQKLFCLFLPKICRVQRWIWKIKQNVLWDWKTQGWKFIIIHFIVPCGSRKDSEWLPDIQVMTARKQETIVCGKLSHC